MNWDQIKGNWKQVSGEAQKQWGKLTNDDISVIAGERTKLAGRLPCTATTRRKRTPRSILG